jgi:hypothetical protein
MSLDTQASTQEYSHPPETPAHRLAIALQSRFIEKTNIKDPGAEGKQQALIIEHDIQQLTPQIKEVGASAVATEIKASAKLQDYALDLAEAELHQLPPVNLLNPPTPEHLRLGQEYTKRVTNYVATMQALHYVTDLEPK